MKMEETTEDIVRCMARVMGPLSAAAKALHDFESRVAAGEDVIFYKAPAP